MCTGRRRRYQVNPVHVVFSLYFVDISTSCNWLGGHASALAMNWTGAAQLAQTPFTNMTINGSAVAAIQNVKNFSFAYV